MVKLAFTAQITIVDGSFMLCAFILFAAWVYSRSPSRTREVRWSNLWMGLLSLLVAIIALFSDHVGRLWFPEMSTSGWPARAMGVLCFVVASIYLWGSSCRKESPDRDDPDASV